jgi:ubiquinone/menaquinone biosynthesis C-methylase UbiE
MELVPLGTTDAAVFETFVVPRYLSLFGGMALEKLVVGENSSLLHIGCRTGYPDVELGTMFEGGSIIGVDPSPSAVEIARAKAHVIKGVHCEYVVSDSFPTPFADGTFTHALCLSPLIPQPGDRAAMLAELSRVLTPGGQAVVALPLRGSFQEIIDLLREYALKHDAAEVGRAVEVAALMRPTIESLTDEVESVGFEDVDVEISRTSIELLSARELFEDPAMRLLVLPDVRGSLGLGELQEPLRYVRDAIERYWAEGNFELTLNVGCFSAVKT